MEWGAPGSVQGPQPQTSSISALTGRMRPFSSFVQAGCSAREGALKACGTCVERRGGGVCERTELLIKIAQSDAIERLVVTLC